MNVQVNTAWNTVLAAREKLCMISLPFPSATLSGHNNGRWKTKAPTVAKHRKWARDATLEVKPGQIPEEGDLFIHVRFVPANNLGDRVNYPNRMKPYFDGLADALGVNDKRFLPSFEFCAPYKTGFVEMEVWA